MAVEILNECAAVAVSVNGHTDWIGPESYNDLLSQRRADAVRRYLVAAGVSAERLEAAGFGESQPVATNESAEGRQQNRRVELQPQF